MATTMASPTTTAPDVKALRQRLADAQARHAGVADDLRRIAALVSPYIDDKPPATRAEQLRARAREPDVRHALALAEADVADCEHALRAAQDREREARRAEFARRKAPIIQRLAQALDAAAQINTELLRTENEEPATVRAAWPELFEETPTTGSRLVDWRHFIRSEYGIDVP